MLGTYTSLWAPTSIVAQVRPWINKDHICSYGIQNSAFDVIPPIQYREGRPAILSPIVL